MVENLRELVCVYAVVLGIFSVLGVIEMLYQSESIHKIINKDCRKQ